MDFLKKLLDNILSKKLWVAIAAFATYLADDGSGQAWPIILIGAVYVAAQAYLDATKAKNGGK